MWEYFTIFVMMWDELPELRVPRMKEVLKIACCVCVYSHLVTNVPLQPTKIYIPTDVPAWG